MGRYAQCPLSRQLSPKAAVTGQHQQRARDRIEWSKQRMLEYIEFCTGVVNGLSCGHISFWNPTFVAAVVPLRIPVAAQGYERARHVWGQTQKRTRDAALFRKALSSNNFFDMNPSAASQSVTMI
jgi:hypothetical protein